MINKVFRKLLNEGQTLKAEFSEHYFAARLRRSYELVVCPQPKRHVLDVIKASGQPFAIVLGKKVSAPNFIGNVSESATDAAKGFAAHCARRKVRRVVVVAKWRGDGDEALAELSTAGVDTDQGPSICEDENYAGHVDTQVIDKAADVLLEYLRNGDFPQDCTLGPAYRIGGSFR